jgi:hypothetical protein
VLCVIMICKSCLEFCVEVSNIYDYLFKPVCNYTERVVECLSNDKVEDICLGKGLRKPAIDPNLNSWSHGRKLHT